MTISDAPQSNVFVDDAQDRALAEQLFGALREVSFDGVGITRESYSGRESQALDIVEGKAREFGLETSRDAGANLVVTLPGSEPDLPFLACGSHLDSVPQGGNFDGAAGVVAGLAVLGVIALVVTLAMACPFEAVEKQALLEASTDADRAETLLALLQMGAMGPEGSSGLSVS